MADTQFYHSNNKEKYPDGGALNECKKCITMHVDNWNPDTFLWILQEIDVPYVEGEWNNCLRKFAVDPKKVTGATILGRYLAIMRLRTYSGYRWKDTEMLAEQEREKKEANLKNAGISEEKIQEELNRSLDKKPEGVMTDAEKLAEKYNKKQEEIQKENEFMISLDEEEDEREAALDEKLTSKEKEYLLLKWGKYRPTEWVKLENLYNDMCASFDIQTASHKDNLVLMCKASLKTHQLLDIGDIEGAQKASRMYDTLLKSGNFSALQNKEDVGDAVDSIGALVVLCEQKGFIPRYYKGDPNDKVDETIEDLKRYTKSLVIEELNLGNLIEKATKELKEEKERENFTTEDLDRSIHEELSEKDYLESEEHIDEMLKQDLEMYDDGTN